MDGVDESVRRFRVELDAAITRGKRAKAQARHDRETAEHGRRAGEPPAPGRGADGELRAESAEEGTADRGCDSSSGETPAEANAESNLR